MNKSKMSMFSLVAGLISTSVGVISFPLAIVAGKTSGGVAFLGMLMMLVFVAGLVGIITSTVKLLSTSSENEDEKADRKIAVKGLWFSIVPTVVWLFFIVIGSSMK